MPIAVWLHVDSKNLVYEFTVDDAPVSAPTPPPVAAAPNEPEAAGEAGTVVTPYSLALAPRIKLSSRSNIAEQFTKS